MLKELDDYDWKYAFECCGPPEGDDEYRGGYNTPDIRRALPNDDVGLDPFQRKDVVKITALSEGENDGANWLLVGKVKDGRWFCLTAGCDYTGWECRSGGSAFVASTKKILLQFGIDKDEKERLGL